MASGFLNILLFVGLMVFLVTVLVTVLIGAVYQVIREKAHYELDHTLLLPQERSNTPRDQRKLGQE